MRLAAWVVGFALGLTLSGPGGAAAQAPAAPGAAPAPAAPAVGAAEGVLSRVLGRALTIEEAVQIALETQPEIQSRLADYAAARIRVDQALTPLLPQLTGSWTAARTQNVSGSPGSPQTPITRTTTFWSDTTLARVSLSQLLFDFGKTFASTDAARKRAEAALEDVEVQRQAIAFTVKESFTNINFAQRLIRVQQQALERAELNLRSARGFFEVGTRPKSDVTRAEVDVANARVEVIRAKNAEVLARVALATAMGLPADTQVQVRDNLVYQRMPFAEGQMVGDALRGRPEVRQARVRVEEAEAELRRRFRDFFPDITGGGFYGAQRADMNEVWELNLALSWSLFDGGNRIHRYREAKVNVEAAQARVKAVELAIARDVEQSRYNVIEADERIQAAQKAVESAQENFRLAQGRFDAGVGTILELTDAQLALTQAQTTEAQALADYRVRLARLELALGRR
jgi:outer membrane protein TolC